MSEELNINDHLATADLFELFKDQLQKDLLGSGLTADFVHDLPADFQLIKERLLAATAALFKNNSSAIAALLYRVDISETQLGSYSRSNLSLGFDEVVAELVIKRVLQKVVLKKKFSK